MNSGFPELATFSCNFCWTYFPVGNSYEIPIRFNREIKICLIFSSKSDRGSLLRWSFFTLLNFLSFCLTSVRSMSDVEL